jgi:hypothetical protein
MMRQRYKMQELPLADLQRIGLAKNGRLSLDTDDLTALLSGRRTDMLRLEGLVIDNLKIDALDVKLSLRPKVDGTLELLLHPIYRKPERPEYLTKDEAKLLEKNKAANIDKIIIDKDGKTKEVLVEFDKDTNEFIITDTKRVIVPEEINGLPLTAEQRERYRKGKEVETADGTTIQYSAKDRHGIRSDRLALIASILIDGGVTYMVFKSLNALFNKSQKKEPGANYKKATEKLKTEVPGFAAGRQPANDANEEQSETFSR